ncbi:MAG: aminomethyl-transferring glycine dehydrogenase subunit GcvPB, partial [Candidatus Aminicenantes bacterium]|nr:aminomethyl-transferring glycine dehydrogenase subunit GcvPB [Candidatus Aminicenantes bacterium]
MIREPLIFEISDEGKRAFFLPELDVPSKKNILNGVPIREKIEGFPQVSEVEIVRHFTRLSQTNYCIDLGFYPLGSCTMKYNPKINETIARFPKFVNIHPKQPDSTVQGSLELLYRLQEALKIIGGFDATSLHPAAGAHGEFTALKVMKAYHKKNGQGQRTEIIIPDSAHGTNP